MAEPSKLSTLVIGCGIGDGLLCVVWLAPTEGGDTDAYDSTVADEPRLLPEGPVFIALLVETGRNGGSAPNLRNP